MDNSKNLELEILVNVMQNKKLPVGEFHKLFEHSWIFYDNKFNQLIIDGFFETIQIENRQVYKLTPVGKARIAQLIQQREQEITLRVLYLKQLNQSRYKGWKSVISLLNLFGHYRLPSQKMKQSESALVERV